MSVLDDIKAASEARKDALADVEIKTSTNLTITKGVINPFTGSFPHFDLEGAAGDGPLSVDGGIPCAVDLTNAKMVGFIEAHGFEQPKGGQAKAEEARERGETVELMTQVEGVIAVVGGVIGFYEEGEFIPHPVYSEEQMNFVTERALEFYVKTPFRVPAEVVEELRVALQEHGFVDVELGDRDRPARRKDLFHLGAKHDGGNARDRILARQANAFPLESFTLTAPRPVDQRPPGPDNTIRPEYEDILRSWEENLHRVVVALASNESMSNAGKLSSAVTGVDGQYPLRATVANIVHSKPILGGTEQKTFNFFNEKTVAQDS